MAEEGSITEEDIMGTILEEGDIPEEGTDAAAGVEAEEAEEDLEHFKVSYLRVRCE